MKLIKINTETGLFIEDVITDSFPMIIQGDEQIPDPQYITVPCQDGFHHPKWTGTEWVEGLEQSKLDEIEYQQYLDSLKPSEEEVKKAQMELLVMNLLFDMEVM